MIKRACILLAVAAFTLWPFFAFGHDHHLYDEDCCHERDCFAVQPDDVEELAGGDWRYIPEDKRFSKAEGRVRPSKDHRFHVCLSQNARWPYCIYILQGS